MCNCEIRKATVCYVHYLRSAWDLLKLSNEIGKNIYDAKYQIKHIVF